jgi:hypothetical protein
MSLGPPLGPYVPRNKKTPAENGNPFLDVGFVIFAALGILIPLGVVIWGMMTCGV